MVDVTSAIAGGLGGAWVTVGKIALTVFYGLIVMFFFVIFMYVIKFKHPLYLIFESSGGGKRFVKDRGSKDKKKNLFKALKNKDITFPYPMSEHEYIQGRGSAYIATIRNQSASFLSITENPHFIPADYDMREKLVNDFKNSWSILAPKQEFWDKYGAQILWVGSMGIFLIVIILILKRMDSIISLGNSAAMAQASANRQVLNSLAVLALWKVKK
jgi:hypothetical protein